MTARTAFLIIGLALLGAVLYAPHVDALGVGRLGLGVGKLGAAASQGSNGNPPASCSNKLDFTQVCNSQYLL